MTVLGQGSGQAGARAAGAGARARAGAGLGARGSRPTALGLSGAFAALAFGGWCTVHGVLSVATGRHYHPAAAASPALVTVATTTQQQQPSATRGNPRRPAPKLPSGPLTPQQLFDRTVPAVVRVNVYDTSMRVRSHGSGFFVDGGGLVITNYHVIDNANFATVETSDGGTYFVEGIVAESASSDLAILKVATGATGATSAAAMPTLPLGNDVPPPVGTKVYAIGHPRGLRNVLSEGLISGHGEGTEGSGLPPLQTTTPMSPGSSGGPLLTADGNVVGVTTAGLSDSQNLNFAVPVARVRQLVDDFQRSPAKLRQLASAGVKPIDPAGSKAIDRIFQLVQKDQLREAVELAQSLSERYGDNPYYWSAVGLVHQRLKNYDLAVESYRRCLRLKPDLAAAHLSLGGVYLEQKKYDDAVRSIKMALSLDPKDAAAHLSLGQAYYLRRQYGEARGSFESVVRLQPGNHVAHTKLGEALLALKRHEEARRELQAALALRPQHAEAYVALGSLCQAQKDYPAAAAAWQNAVRFDPAGHWGTLGRKGLAGLPAGYRP